MVGLISKKEMGGVLSLGVVGAEVVGMLALGEEEGGCWGGDELWAAVVEVRGALFTGEASRADFSCSKRLRFFSSSLFSFLCFFVRRP